MSENRYTKRMGRKPVGTAGQFAQYVADEVRRLIESDGGDSSGRYLQRAIGRSHTYWEDRLNYSTPFNVNDVEQIATHFGMTPLQLIEDAVNESLQDATVIDINVRGSRKTDLSTVPLDLNKLAASTDDTAIDPSRGES